MTTEIHPCVPFLAAALAAPLLKGRLRQAALLAAPCLALLLLVRLSGGARWTFEILGNDLILLRLDSLSMIFCVIFVIMAFLGNLYGIEAPPGQQAASQIYVAGSLGVVLAGDLVTLFLGWEIMAVSSTFLIWGRRNKKALRAGFRYLLAHIFGGGLLFVGVLLQRQAGSVLFESITLDFPGMLILTAFALNAAVPPLGAWLPDAYPEATVPGAVFLSAFTTKTAVYALARGFAGTDVLVWAGAAMTLYGVVFAVLENDIRRLLAYHIISQVGYMVCGIGLGTSLSVNGASAHAFCHILYKGLLFMAAGAVIHVTGRSKLTELGALAPIMPLTTIFYIVGAFSISSVPLFSGFVSKAIVVSASTLRSGGLELVLTTASMGTFLSIGLKLLFAVFFKKPSGEAISLKRREPPRHMLLAMGLASIMCVSIGVWPAPLYRILPYPLAYHPYTRDHVIGTLQLLLWTGFGFMVLIKKLEGKSTITLDTDWLYRRGAPRLIRGVAAGYTAVAASAERTLLATGRNVSTLWSNPLHVWRALSIPYDDERRFRPLLIVHMVWILSVFLAAALVFWQFL
ncbi:MAG: Na(+)/H(+) antiporter subunit D [Vicinamibacteria bacterium]|nr:Na(+)/H(+) antiporter subunit D [Vicinamibacteria bacterium]